MLSIFTLAGLVVYVLYDRLQICLDPKNRDAVTRVWSRFNEKAWVRKRMNLSFEEAFGFWEALAISLHWLLVLLAVSAIVLVVQAELPKYGG